MTVKSKEQLLKDNAEFLERLKKHIKLPKMLYRGCFVMAIIDLIVAVLCIIAKTNIIYPIINVFLFFVMMFLAHDNYQSVQEFQRMIDGCIERRHQMKTML